MKHRYFIRIFCLGLMLLGVGLCAQVVYIHQPLDKHTRKAYVDDSYYWPRIDTILSSEPNYDRNAREFLFIEDTTQYPDTVRMQILER